MKAEKLIKLAERNEVSLFDHGGRKSSPPYYYSSLRHALGFYFNTFMTNNIWYADYAFDIPEKKSRSPIFNTVDEENSVNTIIFFERFLELFIKDLLKRVDRRLTYATKKRLGNNKVQTIITLIRTNSFEAKTFNNKPLLITFREAIDRFYELIDLNKSNNSDRIVKKFARIIQEYNFLDCDSHEETLYLLSWYRDRILHNGNRVPSLLLLDYIISQRVIPIINDISETEKNKLGEALFYFKTETGINILDKISTIKFEIKNIKDINVRRNLLYLGHLKELGRANLTMNIYVRRNIQATYEYNYKDPKGRAKRFAEAEKTHDHFKEIRLCPCCGEKTLVVYRHTIDDVLFNPGQLKDIDWIKCYLCDYHLRYNVGDPHLFNLNSEILFDSDSY